jgi:outer membrane protein OmpA-like peptidoglycan-associated protein
MNNKRLCYVLIGAVLLMTALGSAVALAADCKVLYEGIRKERVLMKKKALVAVALKACPNDPAIIYQDGYVFERLRKYGDALVKYRKAIALDPNYAKAYFSIGDIEALQNNYSEAVDAYTEGLRHEPGNERARGSLKVAQAKKRGAAAGKEHVAPVVAPPVFVAKVSPVLAKKKVDVPKTSVAVATKFAVAPITRLNVQFNQKSATLSQDAQDVLSVVVGQAMNRKDMRGNSFEVGGHTDNLGDAGKNYDISKKRAINVKKYLTKEFAINSSRLKLAYHGQKKSKVRNNSPANRALNRRVDFTAID